MELKETVELMNSSNYKDRFKAEYYQTKTRYEKLKAFNNKIEAGRNVSCNPYVKEPIHDCPDYMLKRQQEIMEDYLHSLEVRAVIENVEL